MEHQQVHPQQGYPQQGYPQQQQGMMQPSPQMGMMQQYPSNPQMMQQSPQMGMQQSPQMGMQQGYPPQQGMMQQPMQQPMGMQQQYHSNPNMQMGMQQSPQMGMQQGSPMVHSQPQMQMGMQPQMAMQQQSFSPYGNQVVQNTDYVVPKGTITFRIRQAKNLPKKDEYHIFIEYQGKEWESKKAKKEKNPIWNQNSSMEFADLNQKSVIPIQIMKKDEMIGIAAIPLAGIATKLELIKMYKLEGCKTGEIEIGITTDFSIPPCDPIVYSSAITDTVDRNLESVDPITFKKYEEESKEKKEKRASAKEKRSKSLKAAGKFLGKFVKVG